MIVLGVMLANYRGPLDFKADYCDSANGKS